MEITAHFNDIKSSLTGSLMRRNFSTTDRILLHFKLEVVEQKSVSFQKVIRLKSLT